MNIFATTVGGRKIELGKPIKLQLCESYDTPASSLFVAFAVFEPCEEFKKITVISGTHTVFEGEVDEQVTTCNNQGIKIKISARSHSQLLDDEALPTTYTRPTLNDIYKNHLRPFGIKGVVGEGVCQGDFSVAKGSCHWAVVEEFCNCVLNTAPRITKDGFLDAYGASSTNQKIVFGNFYGADFRFFSAQIKFRRYGVVGQICYKSEAGHGYEQFEINESAKHRKIMTKRYLNLSGSQRWQRQYRLQRELNKAEKGSEEIELYVPFDCFFEVGAEAQFYDDRLGGFNDMRIFEVTHSISNEGKRCVVTLRPSKHFI